MQMDEGLDTGPIIATTDIPISRRETAGSLHDKLAAAGAAAIVQTLSKLQRDGELASVPQPDQGVSYAQKIAADEAGIDWRASAAVIDRKVRAFDPLPGAQTVLESEPLKLYSTEPVRGWKGEPGQLLRADGSGLVVACGEGALIVREVQRPGRRRVSVDAFLAGHRLARDTVFGTARG